MKKHVLVIAAFISLGSINANTVRQNTDYTEVNHHYYDNSVTFIERGIKFHVFLNGDFDFNAHRKFNKNRGIRIKRNHRGQIRRIGNVFINYDRRGKVKRIGSVFMKYRFGQLNRIGNMIIDYDRWGTPFYKGRVKGRFYNNNWDNSCNIQFHVDYDYDDLLFYRNDFRENYRQIREDDDYLYYRAKANGSNSAKSSIIKRKKQKYKYRSNIRNRR